MNIPGSHVPLDNVCWQCDGAGTVFDNDRTNKNQPRDRTCDVCHGAGAHLTEAGDELAEFIERHFGIARKGR